MLILRLLSVPLLFVNVLFKSHRFISFYFLLLIIFRRLFAYFDRDLPFLELTRYFTEMPITHNLAVFLYNTVLPHLSYNKGVPSHNIQT